MDIRKSYPATISPKHYPGGQTLPSPKAIDFKPKLCSGSVSGALGLREYLESNGHTLVVTADKDASGSVFERELPQSWWFGDFGPTTFSLLHTL
jgi:formate dehydrogenase